MNKTRALEFVEPRVQINYHDSKVLCQAHTGKMGEFNNFDNDILLVAIMVKAIPHHRTKEFSDHMHAIFAKWRQQKEIAPQEQEAEARTWFFETLVRGIASFIWTDTSLQGLSSPHGLQSTQTKDIAFAIVRHVEQRHLAW